MDASIVPSGGEQPSVRGAPIPPPATSGTEQTRAEDPHLSQPYTPRPENGHTTSTPHFQPVDAALPQVVTSPVPQCILWPDGRYTWAQPSSVQVMPNGNLNGPYTGNVQSAPFMQPGPPPIQVMTGPIPYSTPYHYHEPAPPIGGASIPPYEKRNNASESNLLFQAVEQIARQLYMLLLLRIPPMYFSRIFKLFDRPEGPATYVDNRYIPEDRWGSFVHAIIKEWETLNIVSVLALSAILTFLQLDGVAESTLIRTPTLLSLVAAIWSLMFGCIYILRFGTMHTEEKARRWSKETRATKTNIFWNVWIMLAMPAVWLAWSIVAFCVAILAFIWTTGSTSDNPNQPSGHAALGPRIAMTVFFGLGLVYLILVLQTFQMYADDRQWTVVGPDIPGRTFYPTQVHEYPTQRPYTGGDQYQNHPQPASMYYGGNAGYDYGGSHAVRVHSPARVHSPTRTYPVRVHSPPRVITVPMVQSRSRSRRPRTVSPTFVRQPRSRSHIRRRRRSPSRSLLRTRRRSRSRSHSRSRKETRFRSRSSRRTRGRTRHRSRTRSNSR